MRKAHLAVGVAGVVAFVASGMFMRHHHPPLSGLGDASRLLFRSRHIYILASGLVNLMLGLYMQPRPNGWRQHAQNIGSGLLIASVALLIVAFVIEPSRGLQPEMMFSHLGLYALFGGAMAHTASAIG